MANLQASWTVEIDAPRERVWEVAADVPSSPVWQPALQTVETLETDEQGRATLVDMLLRRQGQDDQPAPALQLRRAERHDLGPGEGRRQRARRSWEFAELDGGRTEATFALEADPGRMLGMLLRGPAEGKVKEFLTKGAAEGLKQQVESTEST